MIFESKTVIEFGIAFRKGTKRLIILYCYRELMFHVVHVLKPSPVGVVRGLAARHHCFPDFFFSKVFPVKLLPSSCG